MNQNEKKKKNKIDARKICVHNVFDFMVKISVSTHWNL